MLACLYPVAAALVALFVAYPIVELLAHAALADGRLSFAPLARVLAEPYNRQAVYNTLLLGLTVAVLGTILATLYAYAMTRVEMPGKRVWHFLALLPTISPPILMALSPDPPLWTARTRDPRALRPADDDPLRLLGPRRGADPVLFSVCVSAAAQPLSRPRRFARRSRRHDGRAPGQGA